MGEMKRSPCISSTFVKIQPVEGIGFGAFAAKNIPPGTIVLQDHPVAHVINHHARQEVCANCFSDLEEDRTWVETEVEYAGVFCDEKCRGEWLRNDGPQLGCKNLMKEAYSTVEAFTNEYRKKHTEDEQPATPSNDYPDAESVAEGWSSVEELASVIRSARLLKAREDKTASHTDALARVSDLRVTRHCLDLFRFVLSGIVYHATCKPEQWRAFLNLYPTAVPYDTHHQLQSVVNIYLVLLSIVPVGLVPSTTSDIVQSIMSRNCCNSFGIWTKNMTKGAKFVGHGVWVSGSYFNHSCLPTLNHYRIGREYRFRNEDAVSEGQELTISYLGAQGRTMPFEERQKQLLSWGFRCRCIKCTKSE